MRYGIWDTTRSITDTITPHAITWICKEMFKGRRGGMITYLSGTRNERSKGQKDYWEKNIHHESRLEA